MALARMPTLPMRMKRAQAENIATAVMIMPTRRVSSLSKSMPAARALGTRKRRGHEPRSMALEACDRVSAELRAAKIPVRQKIATARRTAVSLSAGGGRGAHGRKILPRDTTGCFRLGNRMEKGHHGERGEYEDNLVGHIAWNEDVEDKLKNNSQSIGDSDGARQIGRLGIAACKERMGGAADIAERSEEDDAPGEEHPGSSGHDRDDNRGDGERAYEGRDIVAPGGEAVA